MLKYDASEGVRAVALSVIANQPEIDPERMRALLEWAAQDASPLVQDQAAALLGALNPPTEMPEEPAPGDALSRVPDDAPLDIPDVPASGAAEDPVQ
jgi:hypothetical protein